MSVNREDSTIYHQMKESVREREEERKIKHKQETFEPMML